MLARNFWERSLLVSHRRCSLFWRDALFLLDANEKFTPPEAAGNHLVSTRGASLNMSAGERPREPAGLVLILGHCHSRLLSYVNQHELYFFSWNQKNSNCYTFEPQK